jgi:hypothetical protein
MQQHATRPQAHWRVKSNNWAHCLTLIHPQQQQQQQQQRRLLQCRELQSAAVIVCQTSHILNRLAMLFCVLPVLYVIIMIVVVVVVIVWIL